MAQDGTTAGGSSYTIDNVTFPIGRSKLQSIFDAIRSTNIGNTAPDLVAGQFWIDNNTPSTTVWTLYLYDGTDNISFATIDTVNNTVNFLDSTFDLINDTTPQLGGNLASNGNDIIFADNDKAIFGAGSDLQIFHDGSNSYISDTATGDLKIRGSSAIKFEDNNGSETFAIFNDNGAVDLYYDNSKKFETTSTGATVTGNLTASGNLTSLGIDDNATSTAITIDNNENVGIGTTSPNNYSGYGNLTLGGTSGGIFDLEVNGTRTGTLLGLVGETRLASITNIPLTFQVNNAEKMRLTSTGLGIFNSNPGAGLEVTNSNGIKISRSGYSQYMQLYPANNNIPTILGLGGNGIHIGTTTSTGIHVDGSDNVGIGTTAPPFLLSLSGNSQGISFTDTSGGTNAKAWLMQGLDSDFRLRTQLDNYGGGQVATIITRTAEVVNTHQFFTEDSERMRLTTTGLGIGTSSPSPDYGSDNILEIAGGSNPGLVINDTGQASKYGIHAVSADFVMLYGTTAFFRYKPGDSQITAHDNLKIITGTSSGVTPSTNGNKLFIDGIGNQGLTIGSATTGVGSIFFGDSGNNASGFFKYLHNGDTLTVGTGGSERMRINSSGSVGIGTSSPGTVPLNVVTTDGGNVDDILEIRNNSTTSGTGARLRLVSSTDVSSVPNSVSISSYRNAGSDHDILFESSGSEKMRIRSTGSVGIGTGSPSEQLDISSTSPRIRFSDTSVTNLRHVIGSEANDLEIRCDDGNVQADSHIGFKIDGSEHMRIKSTGQVGIGNSGPGYTLEIGNASSGTGASINLNNNVGQIRTRASLTDTQTHHAFVNPNGTVGTIKTNGSATSFNTSSDYRLKENIVEITDATTRLKQLKPKRFNFIADADTTVDGFIAHEVSSVVPEAISGEKDAVDEDGNPEYQGIDQSKLVPLLVKTIQELEARITTLENN